MPRGAYAPADTAAVVALELRYAARYPGATVVNADVYGHPGFAGGRNILCAVRGDGVLLGYAPLFPSPVDAAADPSLPHRLWAAVKPDPDLPPSAAEAVADTLMDHLRARAATVAAAPPRRVLLTRVPPRKRRPSATPRPWLCPRGEVPFGTSRAAARHRRPRASR